MIYILQVLMRTHSVFKRFEKRLYGDPIRSDDHHQIMCFGRRRSEKMFVVPTEVANNTSSPDLEKARRQAASWRSQEMGIADRKSTRLNSSHVAISYAVFCLKIKTDIKI